MKRWWQGVLATAFATTAAISVLVGVASAADSNPHRVVRQVAGSGEWESGRDGGGKREWQLQLKRRADGAIEGRLHISGSAALHQARLEGRVEDDAVYGALVADDDRQIGTFSGSLIASGAVGTYTFTNGDAGHWSWTDPSAKILDHATALANSFNGTAAD